MLYLNSCLLIHSAVHMIQVVAGQGRLRLCLQHDTRPLIQIVRSSRAPVQTSAATPGPGPAVTTRSQPAQTRPAHNYELEFSGALTGDLATWSPRDTVILVDSVTSVEWEGCEDAGYHHSTGVYPGDPGGLHLAHHLHLCQQNPSVQGDRQQDRWGKSQKSDKNIEIINTVVTKNNYRQFRARQLFCWITK